jgi:hypothetical protein
VCQNEKKMKPLPKNNKSLQTEPVNTVGGSLGWRRGISWKCENGLICYSKPKSISNKRAKTAAR